ncbi:U-box domain-containing protein 28-like [Diospyros lotus]|uniref:U-box domain-containing protein 28-like n=1 Tax=Diospyros lotus TaxID=55363 RepID=UPI00225932C7|nr:U-box domain-containing protein 28-like [Diospyros lotus]
MVRENKLFVTVPSFFRCPISMDVMKSPVSLCTGVTYDRSSIQAWLDTGHNTCPATMQVLPSTDFVPNLTLRRLIETWSQSPPPLVSPSSASMKKMLDSIKDVGRATGNRSESLSRIADFASRSEENREFLSSVEGFIATVVGVLRNASEIEMLESAMTVLDLVASETRAREQLHRLILDGSGDCLSPFVSALQRGSSNLRVRSARVLESIAFDSESRRLITEKQGLLYQMYRLASSETDMPAAKAGLSCLIAVSASRPVKKELVRLGIVRTAGQILSRSEADGQVIDKAMKMLEMVSTCAEGRAAIGGDKRCVVAIVRRLMKGSREATENGVAVLWSVCYLSRDGEARETAMKINGLAKVLLVMQSDCSGMARKMGGDLVKLFRVNSKSCLASYQTKTTHIMPY